MQSYASRRRLVSEAIDGGVAVLPAARTILRNNDTEFEFRQDSDFFYLTGFGEPDAILVLAPHHPTERSVLFLRPRDRALETWTGKRLGVEAAPTSLGFDAAYDIAEFSQRLPDFLTGATTLYYRMGLDETNDRRILGALNEARHRVRRGGNAPRAIEEPGKIVHEMRLFKQPDEIERMRRAGSITRAGHIAAMRATRPGIHEFDLEAILEYTYRTNGAQDIAYPSIVAGGDNATILHYNTNREMLHDGDLVLIDSGSEFDLYASDVTRTWPVNGRFTAEQRAIYEIVLAAQKAGIEQVRPGNSYRAYHERAVDTIVDGLIDIGLLRGSRAEAIESKKYLDFYMHNTGHWIGLDVHDVGQYRESDGTTYRKLQAGMAMTVEPGLYVARDLDVDERWKGIGVRIEDDILCTPDGNENLTAGIPKEIDELESLVGADAAVVAR
ncbi:MAG: aminopeptidase P N-terminal domain-containing protein [Candidatus Eremiobacteraeota bacterium]|nr:aminopeptidase P N-terminal domain-containing protein [Candidatus Eremiobacteraeota bacterium]